MPISTPMKFKIHHKNDLAYIQVLTKYGKYISVDKINSQSIASQPNLTYLRKLLKSFNPYDDGYTEIEAFTHNSASTMGLFPKINQKKLLSCIPGNLSEKDHVIAKQNADVISQYIIARFNLDKKEQEIPVRLGNLIEMNHAQAILTFSKLQALIQIGGSILINEGIQTILFQVGQRNYYIEINNHSCFGECPHFVFHAGDGFSAACDHFPMAKDHPILTTLNKHFIAWKMNNYKDEIIPVNQSGFDSANIQACMQSNTSSSNHSIAPKEKQSFKRSLSFWENRVQTADAEETAKNQSEYRAVQSQDFIYALNIWKERDEQVHAQENAPHQVSKYKKY